MSSIIVWRFYGEIILKCKEDPFHCGMPKKIVVPGLITDQFICGEILSQA